MDWACEQCTMKPKLDCAWAIGLVVSLAVGPAGLSAWSLGLGLVKGSKPTLTFFYFLSFPFGRPVFLSFFHLFSPLLFSSVFLCFSSASGFFFYSVSFFFLFFIFFSWPVRPTIGSPVSILLGSANWAWRHREETSAASKDGSWVQSEARAHGSAGFTPKWKRRCRGWARRGLAEQARPGPWLSCLVLRCSGE